MGSIYLVMSHLQRWINSASEMMMIWHIDAVVSDKLTLRCIKFSVCEIVVSCGHTKAMITSVKYDSMKLYVQLKAQGETNRQLTLRCIII